MADRLSRPTQDKIDRLATELQVVERDVRAFAEQLMGLTRDEAINLLDDFRERRSWNMQTYMACAELLDEARQAAS